MGRRWVVVGPLLAALVLSLVIVPRSYSQAVSPPSGQGDFAANPSTDGPARPTHVPGELIVKLKPGAERDAVIGASADLGVKEKRPLLLDNFQVVTVPTDRALEQVASALRRNPAVEAVEVNGYAYADADPVIPNDPGYPLQWHFPMIQMPEAWAISSGAGVKVAVLDSGIAFEDYLDPMEGVQYRRASDFAADAFVSGWDFTKDNVYPAGYPTCGPRRANDAHANDDLGHGTHVAGTIAQATNNTSGVAGIAYGAKLMPVKVLDCNGGGAYDDIVDGIKWAADQGAKVINLSLGGKDPSTALEAAVNYAVGKGAVVVASSGNFNRLLNNPPDTWNVVYPAAYPNAIAVGAVGATQARASYSKYGAPLDLVAPGGDGSYGVLQQSFAPGEPGNLGYYYMQGTSMAAPHVSGVAALLVASGKNTPFRVREALVATAIQTGQADDAPGWDQYYGHGLIQAAAALRYQSRPVHKIWLPLVTRN